MPENLTIKILRAQAWARAKGEMEAALATFYSNSEEELQKNREIFKKVEDFIQEIDSEGLME